MPQIRSSYRYKSYDGLSVQQTLVANKRHRNLQ
ncbi:MAG: hypothetical protein HRT54_21745 [Colwellia sp.]|nr:hypothetical protein [Colwellia sp.]